jgi:hypothetical protein
MFVLTYDEFVIFTLIFILGTQFIIVTPVLYFIKQNINYATDLIEDLRRTTRRQNKTAGQTEDAEVP